MVAPHERIGCSFAVELDAGWLTTQVTVTSVATVARSLELRRGAGDHWWRDGEPADDLDGCQDVDVAATPLTNTFPVKRLDGLAVGDSWTGSVAWVDVPTLRVTRVEQTYAHGSFLITTDSNGLVVDYEDFAARIRG